MFKPLRAHPALSLLALCLAVVTVASCDAVPNGQFAGLGGGNSSGLIVYGTAVSNTSGGVVATITVLAEDSLCSGTVYGSATGTSAATGAFRLSVNASSPLAGCVFVKGTEAGNSDSTTVGGVSFGTGDSVQVTLTFP